MTREEMLVYEDKLKKDLELGFALEKLMTYPEWKLIIEQGYFGTNLNVLVDMYSMVQPNSQTKYAEKIAGIGHLKAYLNSIKKDAEIADADIKQYKNYEVNNG